MRNRAIPGRIASLELLGDEPLYLHDPEGNLLRLQAPRETTPLGARGVLVGVSELDHALAFYQEVLGVTARCIVQSRLYLLARNGEPLDGVFRVAQLPVGDNWMELVERISPRGRSIPFATSWGDLGYLQLCFSLLQHRRGVGTAERGRDCHTLCS